MGDTPTGGSGGTDAPPAPRFVWTVKQRRALLCVLALLCGLFAIRLALNPSYVSNPQPDEPPRYHELADRIDPNTADWQTLAALPTLGEKRAKAIVEYRQERLKFRPGQAVYNVPGDLLAVKGIGPAMVVGLRPYLVFPTDRPAGGAATTRAATPSSR